MPDFTIRRAVHGDEELILTLLAALAEYENLQDKFFATKDAVARDFFAPQSVVICDLAFADAVPAGIVTWYWTYSSFAVLRKIFVEDLFVYPIYRGCGLGRAMLAALAKNGADALEWAVLDWNAPSITFYESLGAKPVRGWQNWRMDKDAMKKLGTP